MVAEAGLQLLFLVLAVLDEWYMRRARQSRRVVAARMPSLACMLDVEEQLAAGGLLGRGECGGGVCVGGYTVKYPWTREMKVADPEPMRGWMPLLA